MGILKERLQKAFNDKKNDLDTFVWKGEKKLVNKKFVQEEIKLIDCDITQLQKYYDYCKQMLYNTDKRKPGRYVLLNLIHNQIDRCNCELFFRFMKEEVNKSKFSLYSELKRVIDDKRNEVSNIMELPISSFTSNLPSEFQNLKVSLILDGCLDRLGTFNKQHLTINFIIKQGIWLNSEDKKELNEKDNNNKPKDKLELIKSKFDFPNKDNIHFNPKGLNYSEFKTMVDFKNKKYPNFIKYSDIKTDVLKILRNKLLFALIDDCELHIRDWEKRKKKIKMVAEYKGFSINE